MCPRHITLTNINNIKNFTCIRIPPKVNKTTERLQRQTTEEYSNMRRINTENITQELRQTNMHPAQNTDQHK